MINIISITVIELNIFRKIRNCKFLRLWIIGIRNWWIKNSFRFERSSF